MFSELKQNAPVAPRPNGCEGAEIDRHRHHESAAVIGVLANEIYAARRGAPHGRILLNPAVKSDEAIVHLYVLTGCGRAAMRI